MPDDDPNQNVTDPETTTPTEGENTENGITGTETGSGDSGSSSGSETSGGSGSGTQEGSGSGSSGDSQSTETTNTPEEILAEVKAAMSFQRLYTYRSSRYTTFVINLTDKPLFVPYFGRRGVVLPVVTQSNKTTVAMECRFRPAKSIRKRLAYTLKLVEDIVNKKISIGSDTEIAEDIDKLLQD